MTSQNLILSHISESFLNTLEGFGVVERGHFEVKGKAEDGTRLHTDFFVNYRLLTTAQEKILTPLYIAAIEEFFKNRLQNLLIVGVAMGSLSLPKVIQLSLHGKYGIEYAYTEKREGILGIFGEQAKKCEGKHLLFLEDVCNNATSSKELIAEIYAKKEDLGITGYSILYGVHRGHAFLEEPKNEVYAMSMVYAPSYHQNDCPACAKNIPLRQYKK
ncbi:MAG: hypothetical protein WCJ84_05820 [Candidatus Peregrinibacteria bacterium]